MPAEVTTTPLKVIVCDDSETVRRHLVKLLTRLPYVDVTGETADVAHTLEAVAQTRPDVVVLDISLPDGSGIEALQQIRDAFPQTRVIMLTNYANSYFREACMQAGASYFFDKSKEFEKVGKVLTSMTADASPAS